MAASDSSGNTLPAGFGASYLQVMADLLGRHGADAVLRRAGLEAWIGSAPGDEPLDFARSAALLLALEETLGRRGARGLARRMGAAAFQRVLQPVGPVTAMHESPFQSYPAERRLRVGLYGLARTLGSISSAAATTRDDPAGVTFRLEPCPDCWGRTSDAPACPSMHGMLVAAAKWIVPDAPTQIEESACRAQGAPACEFSVTLEAAG